MNFRTLVAFARDERGAEVVEYALVLGMVSMIALTAIAAVGTKVLSYWRSLDGALGV